jgi:hypothetical protein
LLNFYSGFCTRFRDLLSWHRGNYLPMDIVDDDRTAVFIVVFEQLLCIVIVPVLVAL